MSGLVEPARVPPGGAGPVVRVGAHAIVLDEAGRILLARISEPTPDDGRWTLPGGGLNLGETPVDGCRREVEEETGYLVEPGPIAFAYSLFVAESAVFDGRPLHFVSVVYRAAVVGGDRRDEVGGTTDRCAWFGRDEVATLPHVGLVRDAIPHAWPDRAG